MKRYQFSQYDSCPVVDYKNGDSLPVEDFKVENDNVFRLIYAPDPLTGRPRSDLGVYLSENTSPVVRDFIERQLRTDFSGRVPKVPEGLSDNDIAYLTKDSAETVDDYCSRVSDYLHMQKESYGRAMARKRAIEVARKRRETQRVQED